MMAMDMSQYIELFIEETREHLQGLNQSLLQLEKNPEDSAVLNEIFRAAHTIKGTSGTMGFHKMAGLTHDMENVLHLLRNNELKVTTGLIDLLFKCLAALENYLDNVINTGNEGNKDCNDIIQALNDVLNKKGSASQDSVKPSAPQTAGMPVISQATDGKPAGQAANPAVKFHINQYEQNVINKALEQGFNVFQITVVLNNGCVLKSARAYLIFQVLERYGEVIKSVPSTEDIEDEKFDFQFTVVVVSKEKEELYVKELNSISEIDDVIITVLKVKPAEVLKEAQDVQKGESKDVPDAMGDNSENSGDKPAATGKKIKVGKTVRVDIDRLDILMNLVSELIIQKTRLEGIEGIDKNQTFVESLESLESITTELHDAVMKVRMVPIETVFNRFPRTIRDIAREIDKQIDLIISGEETELDKTVVDEIGDPLIHLLRNSADHGLETTEKRIDAGKSVAGKIWLRAYQDGNNVIIEVEDDGQGIDLEKVRQKAVEKGGLSKEAAKNMNKKDCIDLLFKPSFSTADKVTDLSGRGVGLDVVKTKIEALGGVVEVETEMGKGSKFSIRLPLTLAIIQALMVYIGQEKYAIPISSIKQIIKIKPEDIKYVQKQEVFMYMGTVIPVIKLGKVLQVPGCKEDAKQLTVVMVRKGDKLSGFVVDSLIGQQEIVIKSLGKLLAGIKHIAGATILGDGNVALILDVNSLV